MQDIVRTVKLAMDFLLPLTLYVSFIKIARVIQAAYTEFGGWWDFPTWTMLLGFVFCVGGVLRGGPSHYDRVAASLYVDGIFFGLLGFGIAFLL